MGNMSYCRFTNTLDDLADCWDHIEDTDLSVDEAQSRQELVSMCKDIVANYDENIDDEIIERGEEE
jgi:hypothetical protein